MQKFIKTMMEDITEDQMVVRHNHCIAMKENTIISQDVDCNTWIFTKEGNEQISKI